MGGSAMLIAVFAVVAAAVLGLWALRRSSARVGASNGNQKTKNQADQWGVRISAPAKERACPQVREVLGKEFPLAEKPLLPLPDCPYPHKCDCCYVKLFNRRRQERRSGLERRQGPQRFDKDHEPRRSGHDRRKKNTDWDFNN